MSFHASDKCRAANGVSSGARTQARNPAEALRGRVEATNGISSASKGPGRGFARPGRSGQRHFFRSPQRKQGTRPRLCEAGSKLRTRSNMACSTADLAKPRSAPLLALRAPNQGWVRSLACMRAPNQGWVRSLACACGLQTRAGSLACAAGSKSGLVERPHAGRLSRIP